MAEVSSSSLSVASRTASLILRIFSFALLLIALIVLATNTIIVIDPINYDKAKIHFNDFYAYRYVFATIVIGAAYSLVQLVLSLVNVVSGGEGMIMFAFFGDKLMSYFLATGAAAGFGVTLDLKSFTDAQGLYMSKFYEKAYAASSLLLLAFICVAALSIISAFALPRRSQ